MIDKTALVRAQVPAADRRDAASNSAVFATTSRHYRPNWSSLRYDPAESARLLGQAGCRPSADGIYVCAGGAARAAGVDDRGPNRTAREALRIISEQLRRAGIEVRPEFSALGPLGQVVQAARSASYSGRGLRAGDRPDTESVPTLRR